MTKVQPKTRSHISFANVQKKIDLFAKRATTILDHCRVDERIHANKVLQSGEDEQRLLDLMKDAPLYCVDIELVKNIINNPEASDASLRAMQECGVLRLPMPEMQFEIVGTNTSIANIKEMGLGEDNRFHFEIMMLICDGKEVKHNEPNDIRSKILGPMHVKTNFLHFGMPGNTIIEYDEYLNRDYGYNTKFLKDIGSHAVSWIKICLLITHTMGIEKEIIHCEKLNASRARSGKNPIPTHTYVHVNKIRRQYEDSEETGGTVRMHLRAGHTRRQRYGIGRKKTKLVFIEPVIVNYTEGEELIQTERRVVE